jgi:GTP-binding protein EngB required for normal cell division
MNPFEEPKKAILLIGKSKTGKSSFINEMKIF